jgi:hypothetical protein
MSKINAGQLTQITVDVPELRFPGARSQDTFWSNAAWNLENGYPIGGGGVKEAVAFVLKQIGEQLEQTTKDS